MRKSSMEFKNNFIMKARVYRSQYTITQSYSTTFGPQQNLQFVGGIGRAQAASKNRYTASLLIMGKRGSQFMFMTNSSQTYGGLYKVKANQRWGKREPRGLIEHFKKWWKGPDWWNEPLRQEFQFFFYEEDYKRTWERQNAVIHLPARLPDTPPDDPSLLNPKKAQKEQETKITEDHKDAKDTNERKDLKELEEPKEAKKAWEETSTGSKD